MNIDGMFVLLYGMVICGVDFNGEVCRWFICYSKWAGVLWGRLKCRGRCLICGSIWVGGLWGIL